MSPQGGDSQPIRRDIRDDPLKLDARKAKAFSEVSNIEQAAEQTPIDALFVGPRTQMASPLANQLGCEFDEGPLGPVIRVDGEFLLDSNHH